MNARHALLGFAWAALVVAAGPRAQAGVVAEGAKVVKAADNYEFTEGPAADADGNVYFTDQPNDRIIKWTVDGKFAEWLKPAGRANGLCMTKDGEMIACADDKNELWLIHKDGTHTVLVKDFDGKLLDGPNDVWVAPDGGMYFTDPFYKRDYWKRAGKKEQSTEGVYHLAADGKTLTRVAEDLVRPNGIIGTPDGKTLYVADLDAHMTYAYDVQADGKLANKRLFCKLGSDGMTIDSEGNVYLSGKGVTVFDKEGKQVDHIDIPESWTANICFAGKDHQTLFITAGKCIYTVQMRVKGAGSQ